MTAESERSKKGERAQAGGAAAFEPYPNLD
jgi:hypothetical protein